jgi:uncharacterized protein
MRQIESGFNQNEVTMKIFVLQCLILMSFNSMAAIGCLPGECPETPRPQPQCSSVPSGRPPMFTLDLNLIESNEMKSTPTGILIDTSWKKAIYDFSLKNIHHPSWGISHSERDYQMTKILAEKEKIELDLDVLFAASFLHDLGGIKGYEKEGVDHAVRSADLAEQLLSETAFPNEKLKFVKEMILGHTYYTAIPKNKPAQLFRDADVLDFLGIIGVSRILAIPSENLNSTVKTLNIFSKTIASKCISDSCKELAVPRQAELTQFLNSLNEESFKGKAL